jgi:hypothetical protein
MSDVLKGIQIFLLRCGKLEPFFNGKDGGRYIVAWLTGVSDANPDGRLQEKPGFREKSDGLDEVCDEKSENKRGYCSDCFD